MTFDKRLFFVVVHKISLFSSAVFVCSSCGDDNGVNDQAPRCYNTKS